MASPGTAISHISKYLADQAGRAFTYASPGMTRGPAPPGFVVDHRRAPIGQGELDYSRARKALSGWAMFRQSWVSIVPPDAPIEVGMVVAVVARLGPIVWPNAARIVYRLDEPSPWPRFGFAYGTLPGHAECGEERFTVEMTPDETVWYELLAYSRPRHWLARIGYPATRWVQKMFGQGSVAAMRGAVRD